MTITRARSMRLAMGIIGLMAVCGGGNAVRGGEPGLWVHVASRAFAVTVSPVDEESRQAETSVLYQRRGGAPEWTLLGECRKNTAPDGEVTFTREVTVEDDGLYYYTSRPVVGGAAQRPPRDGDPAQAAVVVDTLPPVAEFTAPALDAVAEAGEALDIGWRCRDENLADLPATLAYSIDGGQSWLPLAANLPAEGERSWLPPADLDGPVALRLTAVDKAGNTGRAARGVELARSEAPAPPTPAPTDAAAVRPGDGDGDARIANPNRSWLYYLMAVNLMRQNKPRDALQYYWLAVKEDPEFIDAWADIGLAYVDLGAYQSARDVVEQAMDRAPDRIDLLHLLGETYHAEGMALLAKARTAEERIAARGLIDQAVDWYGKALDRAAESWTLADQAASFYRLGEICYYVNLDRDGARAYWEKILTLHSPTPNADLILWSDPKDRSAARERYRRYTYKRVALESWQGWARGYLRQLDARERAGLVDLMPAQRIGAGRQGWLAEADSACGEDDGRSLFSLPGDLGGAADVPLARGESGAARPRAGGREEYSFYAPGAGREADLASGRRRGGRPARRGSVFSGGPDAPPPPDPDPYAFPQANRPRPAWNDLQPYGASPHSDW